MTQIPIIAFVTLLLATQAVEPAPTVGFQLDPDSQETLVIPPVSDDAPVAGKRVRVTPPEYAGTEVFHTVYLPQDWTPTGPKLPIVFEYTGNYFPQAGSTGEPEDAGLGYGISGGKFIWVSLAYVNKQGDDNEVTWWGDEQATVQYAKTNVPRSINRYNADPNAVILCGFSRGSIAVNAIGLYDDQIAKLWSGFLTHDHFFGTKYFAALANDEEDFQSQAIERLQRVRGRPYLISSNNPIEKYRSFVEQAIPESSNFQFLQTPTDKIMGSFPNDLAKAAHNDRWALLPSESRKSVWSWMNQLVSATSSQFKSSDGELVPGSTFTRTVEGKHDATYHVYVPTNFDVDAPPRPILIAFSPGGDGKSLLEKLRPATDAAGWLLVGCDKLRNGMNDHDLEIEIENEILEDVFKQIPHDPQRIYLGGFSGGAMRAYGITARRSEPYAGVLAYGGWLGGPSYQDKPYRKNMSVAMVTGISDLGAGGWVPIDTKTLRQRNSKVKHFAFAGGHWVAPTETTRTAIQWLDDQRSKQELKTDDANKIPLEVLYVGKSGPRADDFKAFLSKYFVSVEMSSAANLTLEMTNRADVLLLDEIVRSLPEGLTKAMLLTGSSAAMTSERYGSKIDWLCQCLDNEAYSVDTSHPIFQGPLQVTPTLVEKRCPHTKLKIQAWKVEEPQETPGLVSSRKHFATAKDSEIISGGVNMKGVSGVPLVREANRLLWGFVAAPSEMTEEGRRVFVNSLKWIHEFDGEVQREFAGLHTRSDIQDVLDSPYVVAKNLNRWFPEALIEKTGGDKEAIRKHYEGRMDYVHVPTGSGLLRIDEEAEQLGTPIRDTASIEKWIDMLDGDQSKLAFGLLQRYTQQRIRRKSKLWREWFAANKDQLRFVEERGYRFFDKPNGTKIDDALKSLDNGGDDPHQN